jgi:quercetin dioxygenase-like cupin family protein
MDSLIESELMESLTLAVTPVDPAPTRKTAMRERILQRATAEKGAGAQSHLTVHLNDEGWMEFMPLIKMKTLFESDDGKGVLFRFQPGACLPAHEHDTDEECVVLDGELRIGSEIIRAGDFHLARRGIPHSDLTSPIGALFYIRTGTQFKFKAIRK